LTTFDQSHGSACGPLVGDAAQLRAVGWGPCLGFEEMIERMTVFDAGCSIALPEQTHDVRNDA